MQKDPKRMEQPADALIESEHARKWRFAEVLASEDALLALWLLENGFEGSIDALAKELGGKPGRATRVIEELVRYGFIAHGESAPLHATDLGKEVLAAFDQMLVVNKVAQRNVNLPVRCGDIVRLRQVRSGAGHKKNQRQTLRGLGLRRLNQEVDVVASPSVMGMINSIPHLVQIVGSRTRPRADSDQINMSF